MAAEVDPGAPRADAAEVVGVVAAAVTHNIACQTVAAVTPSRRACSDRSLAESRCSTTHGTGCTGAPRATVDLGDEHGDVLLGVQLPVQGLDVLQGQWFEVLVLSGTGEQLCDEWNVVAGPPGP